MPAEPLIEFEEIPLPEVPTADKGWGARIQNTAVRFLIETVNSLAEGLQRILSWAFQRFNEAFETGLIDVYADLIGEIAGIEENPEEIRTILTNVISGESQGAVATLGGFGVSLGMGAASSFMAPAFRILNYQMDTRIRSARVDPSVAFAMASRNPDLLEGLREDLAGLGWEDSMIDAWFNVLQPRPGVGELIPMWWRGIITEGQMIDEIRAKGYSDADAIHLKQLSEVIPNVNDLISMAVREAFTPATVELFQYGADFPTDILPFTRQQGLDDEWVRKYWYAHWVLPSIGQGFQMLHRLRPGTTNVPFTMSDMQTLLKTADIAPFFRDRLIEIAYTPLTRVDVRRMYGMGVLDRDGVFNAYLDGGYNEKNAELMTEFTIKYETQEQRDLTRSVIVSAYERSVMRQDEAHAALIEIGYSEVNADLFLAIADTKIAEERVKDRLERAEFMYTEGLINETGVYAELGDLNLPADQTADLIVKWEIAKLKKIALPTKSELEDLYKRDIIDRDQYNDGMLKRRYDDETIAWYTERLDMRVADDAAKDLERTQKEQERIEKAAFATIYQRTKAAMDVEIAGIKLQIADIKLAVNYMVDAADIKLAKESIIALKVDIADWNLAKAEIKMVFVEGPAEGE